jgi:uncharacterized protein
MKRAILGLVAYLMLASISFAQVPGDEPASKEDVQRYLDAMHSRDMMKSMLAAMMKQMHQMVHDQVLKEKNLPPDFEARTNKAMEDLFADFPYDEIIAAMAPVYQKHFTKNDLDALTAFYSTPRGQNILNEMPVVTAEAMQASTGILQKLRADAQARLQNEIAQARKQTDDSPTKESHPTSN